MIENIVEVFNKFREDEYLQFRRIDNPPSRRRDLCAFILLDRLVPGTVNIISGAEHYDIELDISPEALAQVATEEDILYLVRCGVLCTNYGLYMNVYRE